MAGVESLTSLTSLNLSCNRITQISLTSRLIKKVNLSHNRIVSLEPLTNMAYESALQELDLTDNFIGDINQIKVL